MAVKDLALQSIGLSVFIRGLLSQGSRVQCVDLGFVVLSPGSGLGRGKSVIK